MWDVGCGIWGVGCGVWDVGGVGGVLGVLGKEWPDIAVTIYMNHANPSEEVKMVSMRFRLGSLSSFPMVGVDI